MNNEMGFENVLMLSSKIYNQQGRLRAKEQGSNKAKTQGEKMQMTIFNNQGAREVLLSIYRQSAQL